jgi:hypothetical protein
MLPWRKYLTQRYNFQKSKLLSNPQCFEFQDEGIKITSPIANSTIYRSDIFKIKELKPCFIIFISPLKYTLIPRRCFCAQEELILFRHLITQKMDKKKYKLKKYRLGKAAPDNEQSIPFQPPNSSTVEPEGSPLLKVNIHLTKKEHLNFLMTVLLHIIQPVKPGFNGRIW